ncbi:hypothetical protein [Paraflavitalea speifideaquila]|uniref:hypothetical protein n=1 Tax=Paraflavitalea speifideaquila TaxID=3076558 RepID=UPI0028E7D3C2|nr:hypothetical protein [Paraflavitalea speifideiaquila]
MKNRLREKAAKASLGITMNSLKQLRDLLHEKEQKGEIPKHIRETFLMTCSI